MKSLRLPALSSCALLLALLAPLAGLVSCSSGNPVAPTGTILTITSSPSRIGLNGSATILVTGRRPDGNPLPSGTEIRFSASLGNIDTIVQTDSTGVARAVLRGDGRNGTATVTASAGDAEATIDVPIGEPPETAPNVTLSVNPNDIPVGEDSTATVTIIVRNPDNTPAGAALEVILTTDLGSLEPERPLTNSSGTATSILTAGIQSGQATITAFVANADPATANLTIRDAAVDIGVQANPSTVSKSANETIVNLTAFVSNANGTGFQGAPVTFESQRGRLQVNGVVRTDTAGVASNTLTIQSDDLSDLNVGDRFIVIATTPRETGDLISDTTEIEITP